MIVQRNNKNKYKNRYKILKVNKIKKVVSKAADLGSNFVFLYFVFAS